MSKSNLLFLLVFTCLQCRTNAVRSSSKPFITNNALTTTTAKSVDYNEGASFSNINRQSPQSLLRTFSNKLSFDSNLLSERYLQGSNETNTTSTTTPTMTTTTCSICGDVGSDGIMPNTYPEYDILGLPSNMSCSDLENIALFALPTPSNETAGSECVAFMILFSAQCCNPNITSSIHQPLYQCESSIQESLLENYNPNISPLMNKYSKLRVDVSLNYYHLTELSVRSSTAEMFFGIVLLWQDPRLRWDPTSSPGGCFETTFRASNNAETTEIWVPDLDLLNREEGVTGWPDAMATVYADGRVIWFRIGGLRGLCALTGLEQIPFDTLGCHFFLGALTRGEQVEFVVDRGESGRGLEFGDRDDFDPKYQEYRILADESGYLEENQVSGSIRLDFFFVRAKAYYVTKIVVPIIFFTFLSFGMFMLDQRVGERLAFGVSILLVIIAQDIVTSGMLPVCPEVLWINVVTTLSMYWVYVGIIESIIVAYLFFAHTEEEKTKRKEEEARMEEEEESRRLEARLSESLDVDDGNSLSLKEPRKMKKKNEVSTTPDNHPVNCDANDTNDVNDGMNSVSFKITSVNKQKKGQLKSNNDDSEFFVSLRHLLIRSPKPTNESFKMKVIHKLDLFSMIFFPFSYSIFLIVMFATNDRW